jgi:hypothetical protein
MRPGDTLVAAPNRRDTVLEARDSPDDEDPGVIIVERA